MKVVCINNSGYEKHLTVGKVYINYGKTHRYSVESDFDYQLTGCYCGNFIMFEEWLSINRNIIINNILDEK